MKISILMIFLGHLSFIQVRGAESQNDASSFCRLYRQFPRLSESERSAFNQIIGPHMDGMTCYEIFKHLQKTPFSGATGKKIDDKSLKILGTLSGLQRLTLEGTQVTDEGLDKIVHLKKLHSICLDNTSISDEGLKKVAQLPNLKVLRIRNTNVTDQGISYFKRENEEVMVFN